MQVQKACGTEASPNRYKRRYLSCGPAVRHPERPSRQDPDPVWTSSQLYHQPIVSVSRRPIRSPARFVGYSKKAPSPLIILTRPSLTSCLRRSSRESARRDGQLSAFATRGTPTWWAIQNCSWANCQIHQPELRSANHENSMRQVTQIII